MPLFLESQCQAQTKEGEEKEEKEKEKKNVYYITFQFLNQTFFMLSFLPGIPFSSLPHPSQPPPYTTTILYILSKIQLKIYILFEDFPGPP